MAGENETNARMMRDARTECPQVRQLEAASERDGTGRAELMTRIGAAAGLAGIIGAFVLALALKPDPQGIGTHQQLGMPPCAMYMVTRLPCPTCGLTTAFAHVVRLQIVDAIRVQPFCVVILVIMLLSAAWCAATIVSGNRVSNWLQSRHVNWPRWIWTCVALGLLSWGCKIATVLMSN